MRTGPGETAESVRATIPSAMERMIGYFGRDTRRINHALKVFALAGVIGAREGLDPGMQEVVALAALLHDIGIPEAERKYRSSSGTHQQIEGPPIVREILGEGGVPAPVIDRVCFITGHHHMYTAIDGMDFQILVEADFLVNIFEDGLEQEAIASICSRIFRTATGMDLLRTMYLD